MGVEREIRSTYGLLFFIFFAVLYVGGAIIPSKYDGFLYKGHKIDPDSVIIEAFVDPLCPDCKDAWPYLKEAINYYSHRVSLIVHPFALPYHDNSFVACRALHITHKLNTSSTYPLLEHFFKYQEKFYNQPTFYTSRASVVKKITRLMGKILGNSSLSAIEAGFRDESSDIAARISFKYGCSRGVTGTPYFFVNGFLLPDTGTTIDYNGWRSIIDPSSRASMNIIPGLPDDVALLCLAKISHGYHGILECVCKRWREVVRSTEYSSLKAKYGWCGDWLFVLTEGQSATQLNAYDPEADRWHILPRTLDKLDLNHYGFQCVGVCRRFLVIGGYYAPRDFPYSVEFSATKDVVQFDPFKKKWSRLASMRVARSNFACAVIDEKVYVVGGHSSSSSSLQLAEVYDPLEDRWEDLPPLLVPYAACSGVSFNGRLYVIGRPENEIQTRTQMFDPVDQSWHSIENFSLYSNLNADPSPMAVVDGRFYTVDGWNGNTIYVRDVIHEEWSSIGSVPHVHLPHHSRPLEPFDFCVIGYRKYIYIVGGKVLRWDSLGIRRYDIVKLGQVKVCDPTVLPLTWKEVRPMRETRGTVIGSGIIEE